MRSFCFQSSLALLVAAVALTSAGCTTTGGWGMPKWNSLSNLNPMNWGKKKSSSLANNRDPIQPPSISHTPTMPNGGPPGGSNYASAYGSGGSGTRGGYANNANLSQQYPSQQTGGYDTGPYNTGSVASQPPYYGSGAGASGSGNYGGGTNQGFYDDRAGPPGGGGYSNNYSGDSYRTADQRSGSYGGGASPAPYPSGPGGFPPSAPPSGYDRNSLDSGAPPTMPPPSYNPGGQGGYQGNDYSPSGGGNYSSPGFGSTEPPASKDSLTAEPEASFASTATLPDSLRQRSGNYAPGSTRTSHLASAAGHYGGSSPSTFGRTESGASPAKLPDSSTSYDGASAYDTSSSFPLQ